MPKFNLLYFKNLLDVAFLKFFEAYNDQFQKIGDEYVLSNALSYNKIKRIFEDIVVEELKDFIKPYDILDPNYYLLIGACQPKDNILLSCKDEKRFPEKLANVINSKYDMKYVLKEKDINIDIVKFNQVCIDIFNSFFKKNNMKKMLGKQYSNVIFISHNRLDCYSMFKIIKSILGKANCKNLYLEKYLDVRSPIIAINELIDKNIHNKLLLNKNPELQNIVQEIRLFLKNSLKI